MIKRILFIVDNFWPHIGGAEVIFDELTTRLVAGGYKVSVVTSNSAKTKAFEIRNGVDIYRVGTNRYSFTFLSFFKARSLIRDFDIIQTTTFNSAVSAKLISLIYKKPIVITILEVWGMKFWLSLGHTYIFYYLFERLIMSLNYDKIISISESTKNHILEYYNYKPSEINVIYPGVSDDFKLSDNSGPKNGGKYNILFFGRPGYAKGLEILLKEFAQVDHKDISLNLLVSKSPKNRYLYCLNLIQSLGMKHRVNILESVDRGKVKDVILANDAVVVPSLREGFGFSAIEACNLGIPVICSDKDSLPEVVFGKVIFFDPLNKGALKDAILDAYQGNFQSINKKKFSWDKSVMEYGRVYTSL